MPAPRKSRQTQEDDAPPRRRWGRRIALALCLTLIVLVLAPLALPVPTTPYILAERQRLGGVAHAPVAMEEIAPVMARAVVAAEDADFCLHQGFDMDAIRAAIASGAGRGASTISQQTVKNVYLWQGRSWPRKAIEAVVTPLVELAWPKRRILEVYLNVAEMGEGVFGVQAAAEHWFGVDAADLTPTQAARLAAILPAPKDRSPAEPSDFVRRRAAAILDGAATIDRDGRAACFDAPAPGGA